MTGVLEGGCYDRQYVGMSTQEVFNLLPPGKGGGGGGRGGDGGGGVSQPTNEQGQQPFDDHDWEAAKEMTEEDKRELERDIDEAVRQGSTIAGKVGSGGNRDLDELLKTKVDWRQALREFVQNTCTGKDFSTFKRLNRDTSVSVLLCRAVYKNGDVSRMQRHVWVLAHVNSRS